MDWDAHLASNQLPRLIALYILALYSLAFPGYYCFPRYIHTLFFYAFGKLIPINFLLAFVYPKSPHSPQAFLRTVSTPPIRITLSLSCSPLAFWLEINSAAHYCLPDYTYRVCLSVRMNCEPLVYSNLVLYVSASAEYYTTAA